MNCPGNLSICSCIQWSAATAFPHFVANGDAWQPTNSPILPIIANRVNEPTPGWSGATHTGNVGFYNGRSISTHNRTHNPARCKEDCNNGYMGEVTT